MRLARERCTGSPARRARLLRLERTRAASARCGQGVAPEVKRILELARREADGRNEPEIAAEHVLLAVAREPSSEAATILLRRGVLPADLRAVAGRDERAA